MKKTLSIFLAICLVFCGIMFAGCGEESGEITLEGGPGYEDKIYGNGGYVVSKGNYVYFADAYMKSSELGSDVTNKLGTVSETGLYRGIKTESGISNIELMVSKVVGFENAGLYIFKDKLYFATPTIESDKTGVRYDLVTFFSCNLDGSNVQKFYQTNEFSEGSFSMTMIDEQVYLLVYTGDELIRVDENGKAQRIAENVTGVALPTRENVVDKSENPVSGECFVYYTIDKESDGVIENGNILYRADIKTCQTKELLNQERISISLKEISNGKLYYKRNSVYGASSSYAYYVNSLGEDFLASESRILSLDSNDLSLSIYSLGQSDGTDLGIAYLSGEKNIIVKNSEGSKNFQSSITSIIEAKDGFLYYINSSKIYRKSLTEKNASSQLISGTVSSIKNEHFDIDNNFFYFYAENKTKDSDGNQIKSTGLSLYAVDLTANEKTPVKIG